MSAASATSRGVSRQLQALVVQGLRVLAARCLAVDLIARGEEADGHVPAHVPETDEADAGAGRVHVVRLPSSKCAVGPTV